jgi:hypothetical protein
MPIGPVSESHWEISVVEPVSPALEHVKRMLFKPFDLGKWFVIGFCAWLAGLGESGGGFNGNFSNSFNKTSEQSNKSFQQFYDQARDYVLNNLFWIIPVVIAAFLFGISL